MMQGWCGFHKVLGDEISIIFGRNLCSLTLDVRGCGAKRLTEEATPVPQSRLTEGLGRFITFSGTTGNVDLKEFLYSHAIDLPLGKKLTYNDLHLRKILIEDRGNTPYRIVHKCFFFFLREIVALSNHAPDKILMVAPSIAKNKVANIRNHTSVIQIDAGNVAAS